METLPQLRTPTGLLPDAARLVLPDGIVSTGYPATEATCRKIGIEFDPWQADLNRCILAKDAEGLYAADTVALSIPRQVGKTYDVGGLCFADSIINPGSTIVWTAHRFKVARESFNEMRAWAKSSPLRAHIDYDEITTAAGNECIPFRNGSRILFAARERGAVRGFTKVRRLVLDEAQILSEAALSDLVPTMNQAANPQVILMGTPPKPTDPSEVWTRLRAEALTGEAEGTLYAELSALPGSDLLDREAWRRANPSYPKRTPAKAILRMYKLLSPEDFAREALGIWDDTAERQWLVISREPWFALLDKDSQAGRGPGETAFAVEMSWDRTAAGIGACGRRPDGLFHVEVPVGADGQSDYRAGPSDWLPPRLKQLVDQWRPARVVVNGKGPAGTLIPDIEALGVEVYQPTYVELGQAFGRFSDTVEAGGLRHLGDKALNDALAGAATRKVGDAMTWDMKEASTDAAPLIMVTNALWGLATAPAPQKFYASYR